MRKWLVLLLFLPALALAEPNTPYDSSLMLHYPRLTEAQQQVFDAVYRAASAWEDKVSLPPDTAYDDAVAVMEALLLDCPELCGLDTEYSIRYYQQTPQLAEEIHLSYTLTPAQQAEAFAAAVDMAGATRGEDFAREQYLHDALCRQVTYDAAAPHSHSAYGALVEGRAVCDGYARAMALLLRLSGMECGVVQGSMGQMPHAWNLVRVEGSYTWLDVTNDDQAAAITYFYYNITDEWLAATHTLLTPSMPPCTDEGVNWHVRQGCYVQQGQRLLPPGETCLSLRFAREEDYLLLRNGLNAWAMQSGISDRYAAAWQDEQRCIMVWLEAD